MKNLLVLIHVTFFLVVLQAAELQGVKLPDSATVDGKTLSLNGMGLREVHKFGFPVKVYVAGLYLEKKNSDSEALIKNDETKKLIMQFLRAVDREALNDAFRKGYEDNCVMACDKKKEQFKLFAQNVVSVRKDNQIALTFYKDKIEIDTNGPNAKKETIKNADLARNMLAVFINKKAPPTEELRKGLLGL